MLGTLDSEQKKDWKQHIAPLVHAYNCIRHESTGFSPYLLLFGREPKLSIDVAFGMDREDSNNHAYTEYVTDLQNRIKETFEMVNRNADKAKEKQKAYYDLKARAAKLESGDRILVQILAFDGKHKIVGQSDLGPETEVKNGQDEKSIPVIESKIDNVPNLLMMNQKKMKRYLLYRQLMMLKNVQKFMLLMFLRKSLFWGVVMRFHRVKKMMV